MWNWPRMRSSYFILSEVFLDPCKCPAHFLGVKIYVCAEILRTLWQDQQSMEVFLPFLQISFSYRARTLQIVARQVGLPDNSFRSAFSSKLSLYISRLVIYALTCFQTSFLQGDQAFRKEAPAYSLVYEFVPRSFDSVKTETCVYHMFILL